MTQEDSWYRSSEWSANEQVLFYEKVGRARGNFHKQQYARIKALTLIETGKSEQLNGAIEILNKSLEEWRCEFPTELDNTYAALGDAYRGLGDYKNASDAYEKSITWSMNDIHGGYWDYPEMIVSESLTSQFERAINIVSTMKDKEELILEADKFIYHAVKAVVLAYQDDTIQAQDNASTALKIAKAKRSIFRNHSTIGLVNGRRYRHLIKELKLIG